MHFFAAKPDTRKSLWLRQGHLIPSWDRLAARREIPTGS